MLEPAHKAKHKPGTKENWNNIIHQDLKTMGMTGKKHSNY